MGSILLYAMGLSTQCDIAHVESVEMLGNLIC